MEQTSQGMKLMMVCVKFPLRKINVKLKNSDHRLNGHGFGWSPGVGDGQGGLACCGSWGHKESDTTERLN